MHVSYLLSSPRPLLPSFLLPTSRNAIVLHAIMTSFKPEFIAQRAIQFAEMIKDCEEIGMPRVGTGAQPHCMRLHLSQPLHTRVFLYIPLTHSVQALCSTWELCCTDRPTNSGPSALAQDGGGIALCVVACIQSPLPHRCGRVWGS